jgi:hypothetical protein
MRFFNILILFMLAINYFVQFFWNLSMFIKIMSWNQIFVKKCVMSYYYSGTSSSAIIITLLLEMSKFSRNYWNLSKLQGKERFFLIGRNQNFLL